MSYPFFVPNSFSFTKLSQLLRADDDDDDDDDVDDPVFTGYI